MRNFKYRKEPHLSQRPCVKLKRGFKQRAGAWMLLSHSTARDASSIRTTGQYMQGDLSAWNYAQASNKLKRRTECAREVQTEGRRRFDSVCSKQDWNFYHQSVCAVCFSWVSIQWKLKLAAGVCLPAETAYEFILKWATYSHLATSASCVCFKINRSQ